MLTVFDPASYQILKQTRLPQGSRPMGMVMSADGLRLYIATGRGGTVLIINPMTLDVAASVKVGARPWGVALSPDGKLLFAANGPSNDVSIVDLAADKEIAEVKAGQSPWGVTVVPAAR
jgi:YVTN family beta-propeller protein